MHQNTNNNKNTEAILDVENLGKRTQTTHTHTHYEQNTKNGRISEVEDTIEESTLVKENAKSRKFLIQNIQDIWEIKKRPKLRIIGIGELEDSQLKGPENTFTKIIKKNSLNLNTDMPINIQEAYITTNRVD